MEQFFVVAKIIAPIVAAIGLGILARKKNMMTPEEIHGLQQFVIQFALPCVVFNACLSANIGAESLGSMALVLILILASTLGGFYARKKLFPYHNLPLLFSTQETGLWGIPLFMVLFGADQVYHMGVLDLTQAVFFYITVAILSSGKAVLSQSFYGYRECRDGLEHKSPRRGINPLDRSKWILWARGAYQGE